LDMKSSTAIAEKLGNKTYSQLIRQCFLDLSDFVIKYEATIYQHVGDEILLTWEKRKSFKNFNAIYLFFEFRKKLMKRNAFYEKKFSILPEFKAALHMGDIVVAETGDLKREIAFHGDVMNTTARIEKLCNKYKEIFLISDSIKENIPIKKPYSFHYLDKVLLRGKTNYVKIYSLHKNE
jgi:adenylate cyclase